MGSLRRHQDDRATYRGGRPADLVILAKLNQHFSEDERHHIAMPLAELETRMRSMLEVDDRATISGLQILGVSGERRREEPASVYLTQFFLVRGFRRQGIGTRPIHALLDHV